ncbi:MAG: hypothetical protein CMQ40_12385 [Gammaproteobacteria bacterium]|nr:hypothetical protein [Gammaproteobacteria bacterium]
MDIAYLNGNWIPPGEAKISVFDRGFMFGESVYEVLAVYDSRIYALEEHLNRLESSLEAIKLEPPFSRKEFAALLLATVEKAQEVSALIYMQISRGVQYPRAHELASNIKPTVLVVLTRRNQLSKEEMFPLRIVTKDDFRWGRADIKTTSLMANVMLKNEAISEGFDDVILIREGEVTESPSANVFLVKNEKVYTPKKSEFLLHGITRGLVIKLCELEGLEVHERPVQKEELHEADEVWLTGTGRGICLVASIDGRAVGSKQDFIWSRIYDRFKKNALQN